MRRASPATLALARWLLPPRAPRPPTARRRGTASVAHARCSRLFPPNRRGDFLGVAISQCTLELLASVKQTTHDRAFGHAHGLCHLLVAHAFDLAHHDDTTMVDRKCVERGFELVSNFGTAQDVQRVRAVDTAEEWDILLINLTCLVQLSFAPARFAHEVDRKIRDDPVKPGEERRSIVKGIKPAVNAKKGFLDDFSGVVLVAKEAERDREGAPLVSLDQLLEGEFVALLGTFDEDTILLRFELSARSV